MHPIRMNVFNKLDHQRPCETNGIGGDKPSLAFTLIFIIETIRIRKAINWNENGIYQK
jgi:hypothetical protein